jgi:hypothetical protein
VWGFVTLATWHNGASQQEYNPLSLPLRSTTLKLFSASKPRYGLWSKPLSVQLLCMALFFSFSKKISRAASCVLRDFRFQGHGCEVFFSVLSQCRSSVMSCLGFFCCLAPLFFFHSLVFWRYCCRAVFLILTLYWSWSGGLECTPPFLVAAVLPVFSSEDRI